MAYQEPPALSMKAGTPSTVSVQSNTPGLYHLDDLPKESAEKVSELLQENHEKHHVYNTDLGFHNHTAHHLLTLYALGSPPELLEKHYRRNSLNQRPRKLPEGPPDAGHRSDHCKYGTYHETVLFFQKQIAEKGVEAVVQEFLLKGDEASDDLLAHLYTAHPLIHVVFGIEFAQPVVVAEGLAMAAVDSSPLKLPFLEAERIARTSSKLPQKTMMQLMEDIRTNPAIIAAKEFGHGPKMTNYYDGPAYRCEGQLACYMGRWNVRDESAMERQLAELINASASTAAGASVHPGKVQKFDFLQIHSITAWYSTYILTRQPWITESQKRRLVEFQGRLDLGLYAICGAPEIRLSELGLKHEPATNQEHMTSWEDTLRQSTLIEDDGHAAKLIRSLALGERVSKPYEGKGNGGFEIGGEDWLRIANMAIESLQVPEKRWVRLAGYESKWQDIKEKL